MEDLTIVLLIGIGTGILDGGGIYFAKQEPYRVEIFLAALIKSCLVAVMISLILTPYDKVWESIMIGGVLGTLFATIVFLSKGGFKSEEAPYVVPFGAVWGAVAGYLVLEFVIR